MDDGISFGDGGEVKLDLEADSAWSMLLLESTLVSSP